MESQGNKSAFQKGALMGCLAYIVQGISWLPSGGKRLITLPKKKFLGLKWPKIELKWPRIELKWPEIELKWPFMEGC